MANADFALPENVAREILERASRIDAGNDSRIAIDELRRTAQEAGISGQAFDAAVTQIVTRNQAAPAAASVNSLPSVEERSRMKSWWGSLRNVGIAFGGWVLGATAADRFHSVTVRQGPGAGGDQLAIMVVMIGIAMLALAWNDRAKHDQRRFHISNILGWVAFSFGWILTNTNVPKDLLESVLVGLSLSTLVGGLIVGVKYGRHRADEDGE